MHEVLNPFIERIKKSEGSEQKEQRLQVYQQSLQEYKQSFEELKDSLRAMQEANAREEKIRVSPFLGNFRDYR